MWAKLDAVQLRGWQRVVDLYGKYTGQTQFNLVRLMFVVYLASFIALWSSEPNANAKFFLGIFVSVLVLVTPLGFFMVSYIERNVTEGRKNPEQILPGSRFNRLLQTWVAGHNVILCLIQWNLEPKDFTAFSLWIAFYLLACDLPPPPQQEESVDNLVVSGA